MEEQQDAAGLCAQAALYIRHARFFILIAGAGFSADSGLPVYKDVADVEAYHQMGVSYRDLCNPTWIQKDKDIFYGFWGKSFNDYRSASPHVGWQFLKEWQEQLLIQKEERDLPRFFVYTSNVDAHSHKAGFSSNQIYEFHGSCEEWQCAKGSSCRSDCWQIPEDFRFQIDPATMRASSSTEGNHPQCDKCGGYARPRIQMWEDFEYIENEKSRKNYEEWEAKVRASIREEDERRKKRREEGQEQEGDNHPQLVILEVGCGIRIPSARLHAENWVRSLNHPRVKGVLIEKEDEGDEVDEEGNQQQQQKKKAFRCVLVRVNPEFVNKRTTNAEKGHILWYDPDAVVAIKGGGKEILERINGCLFNQGS